MSPITRTHRYQEGSIDRVKRAKVPNVLVYRWRELQEDGSRLQRKRTIGNVKDLRFGPVGEGRDEAGEEGLAEGCPYEPLACRYAQGLASKLSLSHR